MVDWDRVDELRSAGESWSEIAADDKVGFHPDASAGDPGRALRALYHRQRARRARQTPAPAPKKRGGRLEESRWTLVRVGYLLVPTIGIWFALAFAAPSPIGLLVPALPYLGFALAGVALLLVYVLYRTRERRWSSLFRNTVVGGVVLGVVVAGLIGVVGAVAYGCPYLPPASAVGAVAGSGWHGGGNLPAWTDGGKPVVFLFGAVWCPFCSASSWAVWKALTEFGGVSGTYTAYSSASDTDPQTPEIVLADAHLGAKAPVALQVAYYTGNAEGVAPSTSSCYQLAYVTAYSGGAIPFAAIGGKYVHGGSTLVSPANFTPYRATGAAKVQHAIANENTTGADAGVWNAVKDQVWWIMALMTKCLGSSPGVLGPEFGWSTADVNGVTARLAQIG